MTTTYLEESREASLDIYLNEKYAGVSRYSQKGDFEVSNYALNQWFISVAAPAFYPDCPLVGYLEQEFFHSIKIDDECNLIVSLKSPINDLEDEDYIKASFDHALEWLPKYLEVERKFEAKQKAQGEWEVARMALAA